MNGINEVIPFGSEKIINPRITKVAYVPEGSNAAIYGNKLSYEEKVLEIRFNNGEGVDKLRVRNLNVKDSNGYTKEQILLSKVLKGGGHIVLKEYDNLILRVSNIISIEPKWEKISSGNDLESRYLTDSEVTEIEKYSKK